MKYNLTISKKNTYLHAKVTGQNSEQNVRRYLEEVLQKCKEAHCHLLLIEEQLEGPRLSTLNVFEIVSEGSTQSRGLFRAIAYVDVNSEGPLMQFAETVAVNRALPLKIFSTVTKAEKWLMELA